jgi:hypothetical protein
VAFEELNSIASDPSVEGLTVTQRTTVEQMVQKIMGETFSRARGTKLTWSRESQKRVPQDKVLGKEGLNLRLEHNRIGRNVYFVQNGKIYDGGGKRVKLDDVKLEWLKIVREVYENHKEQALLQDPSLCANCLAIGDTFHANSMDEYLTHVLDKHPEIAAKKMNTMKALAAPEPEAVTIKVDFEKVAEPVTTARPEYKVNTTPPSQAGNYVCGTCGKKTSTEHGLKVHTARIHK